MIPRNLLPEGRNYFIAGGYAVCPALATDIDVWVQAEYEDVDEVRVELLRHLKDQGFDYTEQDPARHGVDDYPGSTVKVATIDSIVHFGKPIHLLVTNAGVERVVNSFDLSISQVALTEYQVILGDSWTPTTSQIHVVRQTRTTDERLAKYRKRFNLHTQDIDRATNVRA